MSNSNNKKYNKSYKKKKRKTSGGRTLSTSSSHKRTQGKSTSRKNTSGKRKSYKGSNNDKLLGTMLVLLLTMIIILLGAFAFSIERDESLFTKEEIPIDEEKYLWDVLSEHFSYNEIAVLGLMCNIKEESRFQANNLEDINNSEWSITDEEYTSLLNRRKIKEKNFLQAKYKGKTDGYYDSNNQWVNTNGGYGYCQYTAYEKKKALYDYAKEWFGKNGLGHRKHFDIANPEMQANFILYLLDNELNDIDIRLRNSETVVDAVYIWVSEFECPEGNYYDVAYSRAAYADEILAHCKSDSTDENDVSDGDDFSDDNISEEEYTDENYDEEY